MPPDDPPWRVPDVEHLARIAADPARPADERGIAVAALRPFHAQRARSVLWQFNREDSATQDDLVGHVEMRLWQAKFDPARGTPYGAWCHRVMTRKLVDLLREEVQRTDGAEVEDPSSGGSAIDWEQTVDREAPFSPDDLARVRDWDNNTRRVIVLCRGLLWRKVPAGEWQQWLGREGLPPIFPEDGFEELEAEERNAQLAAALRMAINTLHQHWRRGRKDLLRLDFVKGLRDDS